MGQFKWEERMKPLHRLADFAANKKKRLMAWTPVILLLAIILITTMRIPLLLKIGDFLVLQDDLHPADVIHVISGLDYRTDYGIQLLIAGYAKKIFFTGSWCDEIQGVHAERGKERAINQGIPPHAIVTDSTEVISTYQEATRLKIWIDQSQTPVNSVIVVSDPFHMRRAKWTYRQVLGDSIDIQMAPVPFENTSLHRRWWEDPASRMMVRDEYGKYVYYLLRYGLRWAPLSNWLATFDTE